MRIGMLADVYKPHVSGITTYIDSNKRRLEALGHEVFVFTFGSPRYKDSERGVYRSSGLPLSKTGYYFALRYASEARQALETMDVAHVHHPFVSGSLALRYCGAAGIPILFTNHTRYDLYARAYLPMLPAAVSRRFLEAYMPSFCSKVDMVISPSPGMQAVLRNFGVTSPIEVVPNGIQLEPFRDARALERSAFSFREEDILLTYAGRVAAEKNLEFLIRAFAGLPQTDRPVKLLIVGGGNQQHERFLRTLAAELGLGSRVQFTGMVTREALPAYLAMCDAFVTASVSEVHPLSVIEAMAAGLPVLGITSPGVGDIVEPGVTGYLSSDNLDEFRAQMQRMCSDGDSLKRMGGEARRASAAYDLDRTVRIMLGHYERLANSARRQPRNTAPSGRG